MFSKILKKGSLKANVLSMFIGNLAYAFFSWAQISLVAKFSDGVILGQYTLAIAIITPLYLFTNMQLRSLIITDNRGDFDFSDYSNFRRISNSILTIISIVIAFLLNTENPWIIILFTLIKVVESNSEIINSFFQKREQMHYISLSIFLKSLLGFIGMLIGMVFFKDIIIGLSLCLLNNIVVYIFYDRKIAHKNEINTTNKAVDIVSIKKILLVAFPLGVVSGIISLNGNVSKFFIEESLGTEIQGIYSSISYLIILGTFVCNAIGASFAPRLSKYYSENKIQSFNNLKNKFLAFNIFIGVFAWVVTYFFGKHMLLFFFNEKIAHYNYLLNWIMLVGLFNYILTALGYTLTSIRAFKIQPLINVISLILKILTLGYFIKKYNILGAIYAQLLVAFIQSLWIFGYIQLQVKSKDKLSKI